MSSRQDQSQTLESRLQRLAELKSKGLIDEKEYMTRREKFWMKFKPRMRSDPLIGAARIYEIEVWYRPEEARCLKYTQ